MVKVGNKKIVCVLMICFLILTNISISGASIQLNSMSIKYYSTLEKAIEDANNETVINEDSDEINAAATIETTEDGKYTVLCKKDNKISKSLEFRGDYTFDLNGKNIEINDTQVCLIVNSNIVFEDSTGGGQVIKQINTSVTETDGLIYCVGNLCINGGSFKIIENNSKKVIAIQSDNSNIALNNGSITSENIGNGTSYGIYNNTSESVITLNNIDITSKSNNIALGIYHKAGQLMVNDCNIYVNSSYKSSTETSKGCGICNYSNKKTVINNGTINVDTNGPTGLGISNTGTLEINNAKVTATHSGIQSTGNIKIYDGIYSSPLHGGIYLVPGSTNYGYIFGGTFNRSSYEGEYPAQISSVLYQSNGSIYIAGTEKNKVYINNAKFINGPLVLSSNASHNYVGSNAYISNSTISGVNNNIRVDNNCQVFIGKNVVYSGKTGTGIVDSTSYSELSFKENTLVDEGLEIQRYQMTTTLGGKADTVGIRVIYSMEEVNMPQKVKEIGLVYGFNDGSILKDNLTIENTSEKIVHIKATDEGKTDTQMGDSQTANYYVMTMDAADGFTQNYYVRSYVILEDGTVRYSEVRNYNIFAVAKIIYENGLMSTYNKHEQLYNDVIAKVDPSYKRKDYDWSNTTVK